MSEEKKQHSEVITTKKDDIATITLNRPDKLNAMSPQLGSDLRAALRDVADDRAVRAVIITGAGRSFSAGGDIEKDIVPLQKMPSVEFSQFYEHAMDMHLIIMNMGKPVIAAINGFAVGAGMELTLSCDIRIAADDAKLCEAYVRMGLMPQVGVYLLPRLIGVGKAKLLAFTGDMVGAEDAERMGLVDKVVPADRLIDEAEKLATRLAKGPAAIAFIKRSINKSLNTDIESSLDYSSRLMYQCFQTEDLIEAVNAWSEKRDPAFKGK